MTSREAEEVRAFLMLNRLRIEGRRKAIVLLSEGKTAREIMALLESEDLLKEIPISGETPLFDSKKVIW